MRERETFKGRATRRGTVPHTRKQCAMCNVGVGVGSKKRLEYIVHRPLDKSPIIGVIIIIIIGRIHNMWYAWGVPSGARWRGSPEARERSR